MSKSQLFTATLQMKNDASERGLLDALRSSVDSALQSQNTFVEQDIFAVDSDTKTHAHQHGLTPAKYLAILELQAVDPTATFDNCRSHSIDEIKQQTHEHMNGEHGSGSDHTQGHASPDSEHRTGRL
jgi:hypothetical protein